MIWVFFCKCCTFACPTLWGRVFFAGVFEQRCIDNNKIRDSGRGAIFKISKFRNNQNVELARMSKSKSTNNRKSNVIRFAATTVFTAFSLPVSCIQASGSRLWDPASSWIPGTGSWAQVPSSCDLAQPCSGILKTKFGENPEIPKNREKHIFRNMAVGKL